ncbi:Deoxyguanosinetriphosphate triphosphohydrolase [termite gut metagenome]|uniref:Deoxyguanosinetriphosphate triphosphohydrolase n=1 Tax=termite gut metagenome TaxID=433724 RepID=A0A5J4R1Y6_9ZZZZ
MQLYCFLKYIRKADGDKSGSGILKKAGYFNSEKEIVKKIMTEIDHTKRYPLVYIMEAADDIAYCLSDIEDGLEKNILTFDRFKAALIAQWEKETEKDVLPYNLLSKEGDSYFTFKTTLARRLIEESVFIYVKEHDDFLKGERDELLSKESSSDAFYILKALKNISRLLLFRSPEVEKKEIAGFQIIKGLMEKFKPILELSKSEFDKLLEGRKDPYKCKNLDVEWRFFNILPKKYVKVYEAELQKEKLKSYSNEDIIQLEWFYRAHLIVDFVAGMTDNYSLEVYKLFNGIEIN